MEKTWNLWVRFTTLWGKWKDWFLRQLIKALLALTHFMSRNKKYFIYLDHKRIFYISYLIEKGGNNWWISTSFGNILCTMCCLKPYIGFIYMTAFKTTKRHEPVAHDWLSQAAQRSCGTSIICILKTQLDKSLSNWSSLKVRSSIGAFSPKWFYDDSFLEHTGSSC